MIREILLNLVQAAIGLAGGFAVGAGYVAFLTVLGVIPRLVQLTKSERYITVFTACVIAGSLFGTYLSFTNITWEQPVILLIIWGICHGVFNGMLAAGLTEALNVFPILSRRIRMERQLLWLLMAIVFGKIAGSLFQWLYFVK
ncbi:stage V sporulation protein AB [Virgibacillus xinjiangensis]|uniref:Stage V sporulation protein AB n=1 Tax=Virgibacillus xinjiangensis TaxID=393090 RepID=A0ABV7CRD2_9BACI